MGARKVFWYIPSARTKEQIKGVTCIISLPYVYPGNFLAHRWHRIVWVLAAGFSAWFGQRPFQRPLSGQHTWTLKSRNVYTLNPLVIWWPSLTDLCLVAISSTTAQRSLETFCVPQPRVWLQLGDSYPISEARPYLLCGTNINLIYRDDLLKPKPRVILLAWVFHHPFLGHLSNFQFLTTSPNNETQCPAATTDNRYIIYGLTMKPLHAMTRNLRIAPTIKHDSYDMGLGGFNFC